MVVGVVVLRAIVGGFLGGSRGGEVLAVVMGGLSVWWCCVPSWAVLGVVRCWRWCV